MGTILLILLLLALVYCGVGAFKAWTQSKQTDSPIDWTTIWMWVPRMLMKKGK